jgi:hypothetical protein
VRGVQLYVCARVSDQATSHLHASAGFNDPDMTGVVVSAANQIRTHGDYRVFRNVARRPAYVRSFAVCTARTA